jgi:hypothetical protein
MISMLNDALTLPHPSNDAGKELYIKLYPTPSTTSILSSSFLNRFFPVDDLYSPILPDHTVLSTSFLAMLALNGLLSVSLAVFQSSIVICAEGLWTFICGPGKEQSLRVKVWVKK